MKKTRNIFLIAFSSALVFFATGCRNTGPVTKYGVEYQTRYGVPATYIMKTNKQTKETKNIKKLIIPYKEKHV
jgi:uncharacterized lipoprotein YehR (DUF1307 family)